MAMAANYIRKSADVVGVARYVKGTEFMAFLHHQIEKLIFLKENLFLEISTIKSRQVTKQAV